jgi:chromosome segregation ATPase
MSSEEKEDQTKLMQGIWSEIKTVHQSLSKRFDQTDARLDRVETRLDGVETRLDGVETRLDRVETRLGGVENHLGLVDCSLKELASQQLDLTRFVKTSVERHDAAIEDLRARGDGWTPPSKN